MVAWADVMADTYEWQEKVIFFWRFWSKLKSARTHEILLHFDRSEYKCSKSYTKVKIQRRYGDMNDFIRLTEPPS